MSTNKATSNLRPRLAPLKSGLFIAVEIDISFFTYIARKTLQEPPRAFWRASNTSFRRKLNVQVLLYKEF